MSTPRLAPPLLASGLAVLTLALCADASAALPEPTARYAALPEGAIPELDDGDVPKEIPASETVEGFVVAHPKNFGRVEPHTPDYAAVYPSTATRDYYETGGRPAPTEHQACMLTGSHHDAGRFVEWTEALQEYVTLAANPEALPHTGYVQAVRSERIVARDDGQMELLVQHAWVDAKTTGARLAGTHHIPLALVSTALPGFEVFAFRGDGTVTFVVRRAGRNVEHDFIDGVTGVAPDGMMSSSQGRCHARMTLLVGPGNAESAALRTETLLDDPDAVEPRSNGGKQVRIRPLLIGLSTSWTTSDEAPVLTVSAGWAGRERTQFL